MALQEYRSLPLRAADKLTRPFKVVPYKNPAEAAHEDIKRLAKAKSLKPSKEYAVFMASENDPFFEYLETDYDLSKSPPWVREDNMYEMLNEQGRIPDKFSWITKPFTIPGVEGAHFWTAIHPFADGRVTLEHTGIDDEDKRRVKIIISIATLNLERGRHLEKFIPSPRDEEFSAYFTRYSRPHNPEDIMLPI